MSNREKYNKEVIVSVIDTEGLAYAIQHYLREDQIEDPKLAELWKVARVALDALVEYLDVEWI